MMWKFQVTIILPEIAAVKQMFWHFSMNQETDPGLYFIKLNKSLM